ncbi:MAG: glycosyltransferase [Azospirillum sp.]|nr:glycosyltransferase [Azospirillum sp.]
MHDAPIRIVFVIGSLQIGGAEMHLAQILPRLKSIGLSVSLLALGGGGPIADLLLQNGVEVRIAQSPPNPAREPTITRRAIRLMRSVGSVYWILREIRPDIVHFFLPGAYLVGAPVAILCSSAKRVVSRRSLNDYQRLNIFKSWMERFMHNWMHVLLGNSAAVIADLIAEGAPLERVKLIRNGLELKRFAGNRAEPSVGGRLELICVANLIPYKGHTDLIDALASADKALGDWRLAIVGRDDGVGAALRARAAAAGIAARIDFLGPRDDVPELMAGAQLAVLASHTEGFPNAVIEAMAAGLPVVATAVGGIPEAVIHGQTGLLVPPRAPDALAAALVELAREPERRAAMGAAGAARAEAEFSAEHCAAAYAALYGALRDGTFRAS